MIAFSFTFDWMTVRKFSKPIVYHRYAKPITIPHSSKTRSKNAKNQSGFKAIL